MLDSIKKIARDIIDNQKIDFKLEDKLGNIDGWDSLAYLQIISAIETKYSFKFDLSRLIRVTTISELIDEIKYSLES